MRKTKTPPSHGGYTFPFQQQVTSGKVRRIYETKDGLLALITSDDVSAFDVVLPRPIPYKGVVLNLIAAYFLTAVRHIMPNWLFSTPNPRVSVGLKMDSVFKVEFIVRAYLCGSLWRLYKNRKRKMWGYTLPHGMKENDPLPFLMVTPTTKAENGHDLDITRKEIVKQGLMTEDEYEYLHQKSLELFKAGTKMAQKQNLILVDTKFEFGILGDQIYLIDEVFTPDSSRYFYRKGYTVRQRNDEKQKHLSKEFLREWLMEKNFMGNKGQKVPKMDDKFVEEVSNRYIELYEKITGEKFPNKSELGDYEDTVFSDTKTAFAKCRAYFFKPKVGIIMGSKSDLPIMEKAANILEEFGVPYELTVVSAHRTPVKTLLYAQEAVQRGIKVIIAGAGGAAHLPGMTAASTIVPVIGVPVKSSNSIQGVDSLYSIVQMPPGVPVATVGIDGAENAGLLAIQILASGENGIDLKMALLIYKETLRKKVSQMSREVENNFPCRFIDFSSYMK